MAFSQQQIDAYLERIGLTSLPDGLTAERLEAIQRAHMTHIPYENIDLIRGVPLSLEEDDLFEKMVVNRRGGYCFEQNGLLLAVLRGMGYEVSQFCGRFIDDKPQVIQERRHRVLRVKTPEGFYISDVGVYGESPRKPLELRTDIIQRDGICEYRYLKSAFYGWVEVQRQRGKVGKWIYGFTEEEWLSDDFLQPSFFCEKSPKSQFNTFYRVGIFRGKASLTLVDHTFTVYEDGEIQERREISEDEIPALLAKEFLLEL